MAVLRDKIRTVFSFPVALGSLLALWVYLRAKGSVGDPDIWWHLLNARYLLAHHQFPRIDAYSYTALGRLWINHQWLAELPYYLAWRSWGLAGIDAVAILLVEVIFLGTFYLSYKSSGNLKASWLVSCFGVLLASGSFGTRTILFGYVYLIVLLLILGRYRSRGAGPLWLIPPLFCLWINTHESWALGMIVFGLVIAAGRKDGTWDAVEAVRWSPEQLRRLLITAGASVAALFLNPFSYRLVIYPFDLAFRQKLNLTYGAEWASADFHTPHGKIVLGTLVAVLLGAVLSRYRWRLEELILAALALYLGMAHECFLLFMAIILAPLIAKFLDFIPPYRREVDKPLLNAGLVAATVAIMVAWFPSQAELEAKMAKAFPVQALGFLQSHRPTGNGFNYYAWGGYLEWTDPDAKTFVDSRTDLFEHAGVLEDYLQATRIKDPVKVLDKRRIEWVLFPSKDAFAYFLAHTENWRVVYNDNVAEVLERTGPLPSESPARSVAQARHAP